MVKKSKPAIAKRNSKGQFLDVDGFARKLQLKFAERGVIGTLDEFKAALRMHNEKCAASEKTSC